MTTTPITIAMGGFAIEVRPDQYPDGRPCIFASHPDLPGCVAYADTQDEAIRELEAARRVYLASVSRHGEPIPATAGSATSAHWQMSVAPRPVTVQIAQTQGASPALQTA